MMFTEADLLAAIEAHLARSGETESAFGTRIARDGNLIRDIRGGRSPRMRLAIKIMREIEPKKSCEGFGAP
jgi:hypothetical protein